jgi:DnaJ-class molecular chaperone
MTNHYQTLGLSETATAEEIKSSYRKLAKKYHPDVNKGTEDKFKAIADAYDILGDPQKKAQYDQQLKYGGTGGGFSSFGGGFQSQVTPEDILREFMGSGAFGNQFDSFFGFKPPPPKNQDLIFTLAISLSDALTGKSVDISFDRPSGQTTKLAVRVPAGIENGEQIKYAGQGDTTHSNLPPGDLYIRIVINDWHGYHREKSILFREITINSIQALVGDEITFTCLDKSIINLKIPAGINDNDHLKIRGKGMPIRHNETLMGDLIVIIKIANVKHLTEEQRELAKKLLSTMNINRNYA